MNGVSPHTVSLSPSGTITLNLRRPIPTLLGTAKVATVTLLYGLHTLGRLELPLTDGRLSAPVLKDAIASRFTWALLQKRFGSSLSLAGLKGRVKRMVRGGAAPGVDKGAVWTELVAALYSGEGHPFSLGEAEGGQLLRLAGVPVAFFRREDGAVTEASLRQRLLQRRGEEVARVFVREAMVGQPRASVPLMLRRLAEAEGPAPAAEAGRLRRFGQPLSELPPSLAGLLAQVEAAPAPTAQGNGAGGAPSELSLYDRQHFEALFSGNPDPWKYNLPYEQIKYEQTLSLLPAGGIGTALELACAEGHFTGQLAPLVEQLTAADISQVALQRTAERCRRFEHLSYEQLDFFQQPIPGQYDLVVCSEVLYYVGSPDDLQEVARKIAGAVKTGGYFITAHAHQIIDAPGEAGFDWGLPYGAKKFSEVFSSLPDLQPEKEIRTPLYRVQRYRKVDPGEKTGAAPEVELIARQPAPAPEGVKDSVRWQGGVPSAAVTKDRITATRVPVLMYHRVAPTGSEAMTRYRVTPEAFEAQLKYLKEAGYRSLEAETLAEAMTTGAPLPGRPLMITFDDGYADFKEFAWPLLQKWGFVATVFIVPALVGGTNEWDRQYGETVPLMDWDDILHLQAEGVRFESHSLAHRLLTELAPEALAEDLLRSRLLLQERLGRRVGLLAYPWGGQTDAVRHLAAACGFDLAFTCETRAATLEEEWTALPRIEVRGDESFDAFVNGLAR